METPCAGEGSPRHKGIALQAFDPQFEQKVAFGARGAPQLLQFVDCGAGAGPAGAAVAGPEGGGIGGGYAGGA